MVLVSAWSLWAFAQRPSRPVGPPGAASALGPGAHHFPKPPPPFLDPAKATREARHEQAEEAENEQPAPMNWTDGPWLGSAKPPFLAMLINFGILAAGYYLFGRKPVAAALQNRRDTIAKDIDEAHKMLAEAQARAKTYQAKLETLEEELKTARAALVHAGEAERERIVGDAEAKADRMRKDAEFLVDQELKQIRQDLWKETVEAAVSAAEELLKKRVTAADQERMAEDYLADIGGKKSSPLAATATQESAT
jgi:F-type H+-transporting ATPase subunit b